MRDFMSISPRELGDWMRNTISHSLSSRYSSKDLREWDIPFLMRRLCIESDEERFLGMEVTRIGTQDAAKALEELCRRYNLWEGMQHTIIALKL